LVKAIIVEYLARKDISQDGDWSDDGISDRIVEQVAAGLKN